MENIESFKSKIWIEIKVRNIIHAEVRDEIISQIRYNIWRETWD